MRCGNPLRGLISVAEMINSDNQEVLTQPSLAESTLFCPNCHAVVQPAFRWCPACSTALKPQPCIYCGQMLSLKDKYCRSCGAPGEK